MARKKISSHGKGERELRKGHISCENRIMIFIQRYAISKNI